MMIIRILGLWTFLLAIICIAIDGTKSLAADELIITSLAEQWNQLHSKSFVAFQNSIVSYVPTFLWDNIFAIILTWPTWIVLILFGTFLYWVGNRKKRTSIYIN